MVIAMSGWQVVSAVAAILATISPVFLGLAWASTTKTETLSRAPIEPKATAYQSISPHILSHAAPNHRLTTAEAGSAVRLHRSCSCDDCFCKAAAYHVLVAAGKVRPARKALL
ncbi:hypothetical protein [Nocardia mikamii]|uniref:hypothetical protein n=1 Tax=Nocardia mikamii TaxID=508464 RepID=UPI0012F513BD|nr:hypothetical protein [Nocardia mikamii]